VHLDPGKAVRVSGQRREREGRTTGGFGDQPVSGFPGGVLRAAAVEAGVDQGVSGLRSERGRPIRASTTLLERVLAKTVRIKNVFFFLSLFP